MILPGMYLSRPARSIPWTGGRVADTILREMQAQRQRFGARILALRKERGWNQEDAAHAIDVGVKTWRLWERGKSTPYDANIRKLSEVFGVDPDDLIELPAPLGLSLGQADGGTVDERLARMEERLEEHAQIVRELLQEQSALLEEIKGLVQEQRELKTETDEFLPAIRDLIRGRPEEEPAPHATPRRSASGRK
jgi:transcriptional regulator with XRE-family HTH domain